MSAISTEEMPITGNTIAFVAIGIDPVIGAAATDANVAAILEVKIKKLLIKLSSD